MQQILVKLTMQEIGCKDLKFNPLKSYEHRRLTRVLSSLFSLSYQLYSFLTRQMLDI